MASLCENQKTINVTNLIPRTILKNLATFLPWRKRYTGDEAAMAFKTLFMTKNESSIIALYHK